ncbi:MAG TPA: hypothetical protein DIW20_00570 [Rhodospirillaceae bacterium]|nr:hypothetical protein [Rhodospirillaceae bacterium]
MVFLVNDPAATDRQAHSSWPRLRDELRLIKGAPTTSGAPSWTIHDPVAGRFHSIGWLEFLILSRWGLGDPQRIAHSIEQSAPLSVSARDVAAFIEFLERAELLIVDSNYGVEKFLEKHRSKKVNFAYWMLKNYLFIRIPLINPDKQLHKISKKLDFIFKMPFILFIFVISITGFYLVGRQWDVFVNSFIALASIEGIFSIALAMVAAKTIHEIGHGLAAAGLGCRVPAMGVAFMVMFPVMWTDTTDAWRLQRRQDRVKVDIAGIWMEIILSSFCLLAWNFLPDGLLRTALFPLATTTWVITLIINLNPFMRFDGYFILCDTLNVPNLEARAFALARWRLRETLFGWGDSAPERLPARTVRTMIFWSYCTWLYRIFLFIGIALLVYNLFFKVLGIFLMVVEIVWFIVRPVVNEFKEWRRQMNKFHLNSRLFITILLFSFLAMIAAWPWRQKLTFPAVWEMPHAVLESRHPGIIDSVFLNPKVEAGDVIYRIKSPDLEYKIQKTRNEIEILKAMISSGAFDETIISQRQVSLTNLSRLETELERLISNYDQLTLKSPIQGRLSAIPDFVKPGQWVGKKEFLGNILNESNIIIAYAPESDVYLISVGNKARFVSDNRNFYIDVRIESIDKFSVETIEHNVLTSPFGGVIPARLDPNKNVIPQGSYYKVTLRTLNHAVQTPIFSEKGVIKVETNQSYSYLKRFFDFAVGVFIRETGW